MEDDSPKIRYEFEADTSKVEKAFDDLDKKIVETKNELSDGFTINWGEGQGTWEECQEWFAKASAEAEEYAKQQEQVSYASREMSTASRETATAVDEAGEAAKRTRIDFSGLSESFYQAVGSINDMTAAAQAMFAAVLPIEKQFISDSLEEYAKYEDALYGLSATIDSVKGSMADAMTGIKEASASGLLSEQDVTTAMRNLVAYGYSVQEATEMIKAMTISAEANRKAGYSVSEAVVAATQGIKQGSAQMMKYAGNVEDASDAEANYAAELGKKTSELTVAEGRQALYNSTMLAAQKYYSQATAYSNTYSASAQRLGNSIEDVKVAFGEAIAPFVSFAANLASFVLQNKEVVVGITTFVGVIAGSGGVIWALAKLIPAIHGVVTWFLGLNMAAKGVIAGLATVAATMAVVSLMSSQMTDGFTDLGSSIDDSADATNGLSDAFGGAATSASDLNKQLAKLERDYLEELKQIEVNHQETIDRLTTQIYEANVDYRRAIEERNAEFAVSQAEEERVHQEKVDELMTQIEFLRRYNNDYNKQKLANLEFALAKENSLYQKQTEAAKAELELQNENDRKAYEEKRAALQAELDDELAFMNRHREDLKAVQDVILLDEIDALKRRYEEQKTSYGEQSVLAGTAGGNIAENLTNAFKDYISNNKDAFSISGNIAGNSFGNGLLGRFMQIVDNYMRTGTSGGNAGMTQDAEQKKIVEYYKNKYGNSWKDEWARQGMGAIPAGYAAGGFTGRGSADEIAGIVHKGEYVLPQEFVDQDRGVPKSLGETIINYHIQVDGVFATSAAERRKVADQIVAAINQNNRARLGA